MKKMITLTVLFMLIFVVIGKMEIEAAPNIVEKMDSMISSKLNPIVLMKNIKSKMTAFSKRIRIELTNYDEVKFKNVHLAHKRQHKKSGEKDYLLIKGQVKNLMNRYLSGVTVHVVMFDENGQNIGHKDGNVVPNIIKINGAKKGYFTIKFPYDSSIARMEMDLVWSGKEEI